MEVQIDVPAPREDMINAALNFLLRHNIANNSRKSLESFLLSKGLSKEEVNIAFERRNNNNNNSLPAPILSYRSITPFQKFLDLLHTVTLLVGAAYGVYYFIKRLLLPFIFGKPKKPDGVEGQVLELKTTVTESLQNITSDLTGVQTELKQVIGVQKDTQNAIISLGDIKSELATIKGILLSRHQFPSVNLTGSTSIPAWQMAAACAGNGDSVDRSIEVEKSNSGSQGSDSSLEMIKEVEVAESEA